MRTEMKYIADASGYILADVAEDGSYETLWAGPAVAVCFDRDDHVLHKHGDPDRVRKWAAATRAKLAAVGLEGAAMADALTVVEWPFGVDELNRCLDTTGYLGLILKRAAADSSAIEADFTRVDEDRAVPAGDASSREKIASSRFGFVKKTSSEP